MQHPYRLLAPEYAALLAAMRLDPRRERELAARAAEVLELGERHRDEWAEVQAETGVPRLWGLASFERESGSDYSRSPAQGDRWDRVSVNVPRGLGPYRCWGDACVAAYRLDRLDEVVRTASPLVGPSTRAQEGRGGGSGDDGTAAPAGSTPTPDPSPAEPRYSEGSATQQSDRNRQQPISVGGGEELAAHAPPPSQLLTPDSCVLKPGWTWPRACYEGELFNGFGPRAHGRHTGYLWSWTNIYTGGKYVADGKWNPDVQDQQCGMAPMMAALLRVSRSMRLDGTLALADEPAWSAAPGSAGAQPAATPPSPAIPGSSPGSEGEEKGAAGGTPALPPPIVPAMFGAEETAWLQAALNRLGAAEVLSKHEGFSKSPALVVDGCYGRHTRRAVAAFQAAHGLVPDGLAGPLTVAAVRDSLSPLAGSFDERSGGSG